MRRVMAISSSSILTVRYHCADSASSGSTSSAGSGFGWFRFRRSGWCVITLTPGCPTVAMAGLRTSPVDASLLRPQPGTVLLGAGGSERHLPSESCLILDTETTSEGAGNSDGHLTSESCSILDIETSAGNLERNLAPDAHGWSQAGVLGTIRGVPGSGASAVDLARGLGASKGGHGDKHGDTNDDGRGQSVGSGNGDETSNGANAVGPLADVAISACEPGIKEDGRGQSVGGGNGDVTNAATNASGPLADVAISACVSDGVLFQEASEGNDGQRDGVEHSVSQSSGNAPGDGNHAVGGYRDVGPLADVAISACELGINGDGSGQSVGDGEGGRRRVNWWDAAMLAEEGSDQEDVPEVEDGSNSKEEQCCRSDVTSPVGAPHRTCTWDHGMRLWVGAEAESDDRMVPDPRFFDLSRDDHEGEDPRGSSETGSTARLDGKARGGVAVAGGAKVRPALAKRSATAESIMAMKASGCCRNVAKWGHAMAVQNLIHDPECVNYMAAKPVDETGDGMRQRQQQQQQQQLQHRELGDAKDPGGVCKGVGARQAEKCQECINAQFQNALGRIQVQLHHLAGNDQEAIDRAAGHSQGPKTKWVNIAGEPASDKCRSTVVSRAWAISACWLRTVLTAKRKTEAQSAKWRILFHSIDLESKDPRLQDGIADFKAWRANISREALGHKAWAKAFYSAAMQMQKQSEGQAAAYSAEAFSNWLQEGPMSGLKKQHQMSRTATGWISTKVAEPKANNFEPIDELDGLSDEQLHSIRLEGHAEAPLTAQQIANDEKCKWGAEWAVGEQW